MSNCERNNQTKSDESEVPLKRLRCVSDTDSSDLARGGMNHPKAKTKDENGNNIVQDNLMEDLQKELIDLRCQLEKERRLRISLEGQKQKLESDFNELRLKTHVKYSSNNKALATTRQNLDTIVQAIKHLEGDGPGNEETPVKLKSDALGSGTDLTSRRLIV